MRATFPKNKDRGRVATFEWRDGMVATTPLWDRPERLPHDLDHYAIDAQFGAPYCFWSLLARQAPYESITIVRGRLPKGKQEWFDRVRRKHGGEMLKAEGATGRLLDTSFDLDVGWQKLRTDLGRIYDFTGADPFASATKADFEAVRARHQQLRRAWDGAPMGGALVVEWPPDSAPAVLAAYSASH